MAVGSLSVDVNANLQGLEQGLNKAEQATNSTGQSMADAVEKSGDAMQNSTKQTSTEVEKMGTQFTLTTSQMSKAGSTLTKFVTAPLLGIGTAGLYMASQLEATEAKYNTVFDSMTDSMDDFIVEWQTLVPVTTAGARSLASSIQDLLIPMGFTRDVATEMTQETLHLVGALANFNSATHSADDVTRAFTSALTGEYQSLKALGIQTSATEVQQKAVEMGLARTTAEVTDQDKAIALLEIAYEQSGDALNAFNEENLDSKTKMAIATAQMKDTIAEVAYNFLPIMELASNIVLSLANAFGNLSPTMQIAVVGFGAIVASIGPLLSISSKLIDNWDNLSKVFGLVTKSMKPAITGFGSLTKATASSASSVGGLTSALSLLSNPFTLAIAGATGLTFALWKMIDTPSNQYLRELNKEAKESAKAFEQTSQQVESNITVTNGLISQLETLTKKENLSNAEKEQMSNIVGQLNEQIPDLNLSIDKTTGLLNKEIDAIKGTAQAHADNAREQMYLDRYNEQLAITLDAESHYLQLLEDKENGLKVSNAELLNAEGLLGRNANELNNLGEEYLGFDRVLFGVIDTQEDLSNAIEEGTKVILSSGEERTYKWNEYQQQMYNDTLSHKEELQALEQQHNQHMGDIFSDGVQMYEMTFEDVKSNLEKQVQQHEEWLDELEYISGEVPPAVFEAIKELGPGVTDILKDARINGTDIWAELEPILNLQSESAVRGAIVGFEGLNPGMTGIFDENFNLTEGYLEKINNSFKTFGEMSKEEFIAEIGKTNPELAKVLDGLQIDTSSFSEEFQDLFARAGEMSTEEFLNEIAILEPDLKEVLNNMSNIVISEGNIITKEFGTIGLDSVQEFIKNVKSQDPQVSATAQNTGKEYINGVVSGLDANAQKSYNKAREIARNMNKAFESELKIKSPSKLAMGIGEDYLEGMIIGFNHMTGELLDTIKNIAGNIVTASTPTADLMGSSSNITNNTTNVTNEGTGANTQGITVHQNNTFTVEEMTPYEASILQREVSRNLASSLKL